MKHMIGGCLALALLLVGGRVRADLVVNGGFETGDFSGWTLSGNTGFTFVGNQPQSGNSAAWLGPVGSPGFLSQDVTTTPGQTYNVSYFLASDGGTPNLFTAMFAGQTLFSQTNIPAQGYTQYSFNVKATGTTSTLQFGFRNDPGWLRLDGVSVGSAQTPEPASLALLGTGLVALAAVGWRRRRARIQMAL
jgi:hypothetical protein